jgi:DNA end-binding protein Ku
LGVDAPTSRVKPEELKLARNVLQTYAGELDLEDYPDEYEAALRKMIRAKAAGREIVTPRPEAPAKVVDLMSALKESLARAGRSPAPSRRTTKGRARSMAHPPRQKSA